MYEGSWEFPTLQERVLTKKKAGKKRAVGVRYCDSGRKHVLLSNAEDSYFYRVYLGKNTYFLEQGDCAFTLSDDRKKLLIERGPVEVSSELFSVCIRGYAPARQELEILHKTTLPYVNGCSTRQLVPPQRPGDPTVQLLKIPPHTSEQMHHIHSTARIVFVLSGSGSSVVGSSSHHQTETLVPGKVAILDAMIPHHFVTSNEELIVMPVHVWSSAGNNEFTHPMYQGTHQA